MKFEFGKNWQAYAEEALEPEKVEQGRKAFGSLVEEIDFKEKSFIDIGFGQGLSLHFAQELGAEVIGIDVDTDNEEALRLTNKKIPEQKIPKVRFGSILDKEFVESLGSFDIVHSWGVLHHTGNMNLAICNALTLLKPKGVFVLAIYNRHWSSLAWKLIKFSYNLSPIFIRKIWIAFFYPIIYVAKWLVTGKSPKNKMRGMDFFYDVIDWVGGYPYEYANIDEIKSMMKKKGFRCLKDIPANVPTGCNEFIFIKQ